MQHVNVKWIHLILHLTEANTFLYTKSVWHSNIGGIVLSAAFYQMYSQQMAVNEVKFVFQI